MLRLTAAALRANRLRGRSAAIATSGTDGPHRAAILGSGNSGRPCWGGRASSAVDRPAAALGRAGSEAETHRKKG